jgi:hypothetical protein
VGEGHGHPDLRLAVNARELAKGAPRGPRADWQGAQNHVNAASTAIEARLDRRLVKKGLLSMFNYFDNRPSALKD